MCWPGEKGLILSSISNFTQSMLQGLKNQDTKHLLATVKNITWAFKVPSRVEKNIFPKFVP